MPKVTLLPSTDLHAIQMLSNDLVRFWISKLPAGITLIQMAVMAVMASPSWTLRIWIELNKSNNLATNDRIHSHRPNQIK